MAGDCALAALGAPPAVATPGGAERQSPTALAPFGPTFTVGQVFLNVQHSLTGRAWRGRGNPRTAARALSIVQRHHVPELLANIIACRGVDPDEVANFLDPTLKRLMPDPDQLTQMPAAAERIADAVARSESVAIFGDYDVDGATAVALLAGLLRRAGLDPLIYIPDRLFEGYGPSLRSVRELFARGARLLITLDCGTTSMVPLQEAERLGLDVIVIDHHQVETQLPPAVALVNPSRADDLSGLGNLAAVGLTFLLAVAVNRELRRRGFWSATRGEPDLRADLDLVALGSVADVVPLEGLNRAFVAKGLLAMRRRGRVGLTALMDVARLMGPPQAWHLGFLLGPRINAGGRIGRADLGARLLLETDPAKAAAFAGELDRLNRERQVLEQAALAEAEAQAAAALCREPNTGVLITAARNWHPGIVGLLAARLKERFNRPAFAIALGHDGSATGSGRSIPGVDLGRAVRRALAAGVLVKGGGHAMAAGVSLAAEQLAAFRSLLEEWLAPAVQAARCEDAVLIDGALSAKGAGRELMAVIARAGPFGAGNPEPVFALPSHLLVHAEEIGHGHIRSRVRAGDGSSLPAIAFRAAGQPLGQALLNSRGCRVHLAGNLLIEHWQGEERAKLRLIDVAAESPNALPA